jgi:hypothetical protein
MDRLLVGSVGRGAVAWSFLVNECGARVEGFAVVGIPDFEGLQIEGVRWARNSH